MEEFVLDKLKNESIDSRTILKDFTYAEVDLIRTLRSLLDKELISIQADNTYKIINK